ncbi:MAG TPA: arsenate reductase ArsC [Dissulfurispiraceae bacterium]|nr:arsenate reductase ArsC [Dissulfurispiraceae bacterium]
MRKVLFVCTANSCRSQMAEGFARNLGKGVIEPHSAGLIAVEIQPRAIQVMLEEGIDMSVQIPKELDVREMNDMDFVITLCPNAERYAPATPPHVRRLYWPVKDPVGTVGTEEEILGEFRRARDEIKEKILALVSILKLG